MSARLLDLLPTPVPTDAEALVAPVVVIHGGAGAIPKADLTEDKREAYFAALTAAVKLAHDHVVGGGHALDAAQLAVMSMEDSPLFNAGIGAVFRSDGTHRHDASLMNGVDRTYGAISQVATSRYPIAAARWAYVARGARRGLYLSGPDADVLADTNGVPQVDNTAFATEDRRAALDRARADGVVRLDTDDAKGTVGAVVRDRAGRLAAATSTGGMTNAEPARVGDSAIIGAGTYADTRCAVSCTGDGETFTAEAVAARLAAAVGAGEQIDDAAKRILAELPPGSGGLIAVDADGRPVLERNSGGMYRACIDADGELTIAIHD